MITRYENYGNALSSGKSSVESLSAPNESKASRFTPLDSASLTAAITRQLVDTAAEIRDRERELNDLLAKLEKSGVDSKPLKMACWGYAVAFARQKILEMLKRNENEALNITKNKIPNQI